MLESLGNLGDFVGGLAVVVTLIYLATQIRQHTEALRLEARQRVAEAMRAHMRTRASTEDREAWERGLEAYPRLDAAESYRFEAIAADLTLVMQQIWALHESGSLEEETYEAYLRFFVATVSTPGGRVWWETRGRPIFIDRMVAEMDARLAEGVGLDLLGIARDDGARVDS